MAFFFLGGTTTPLVVFSDAAFTKPLPVPVIADQNGVFQGIYIPYGTFRERVLDQNRALLPGGDNDNIDNPAPPTAGGGIVVTQDMVFQTGFQIGLPRTGILAGFVRMNGNTIGSAASAANELAAANTQNLFLYLWNTYSNILCPVSGGRGASPGADFTANKTIGILSMKGLGTSGLDDMGGTSAGILQAITTCTTNGTTTVTVVSAAGIAIGDSAIVNSVSLGPVISVVGLTVVLTGVAAGSASGISFRSSRFADATVAANTAGVQNIKQTIDQMAVHNHVTTENPHLHTYTRTDGSIFSGQFGGGALSGISQTVQNTSSTSTGLTINNSGGGNPISMLQPTMLVTFYMKL